MGMGRKRSRSAAGLPANLYPNRKGFKYRHPLTKTETWMGLDRAAAIAAAKKLNAILLPTNSLVDRVLHDRRTIADAVDLFRREDMPGRGWAPKTASEHEFRLKRIAGDIGGASLDTFGVKEAADFLRTVTESPRNRQQYRLLLVWILACARQEGWIDDNPAEATRKAAAPRQRKRLTLEQFDAIHAAAPGWLRNAMDLSRLTLLRREDVCSLRFSDIKDGRLWVVPSKTEGSTGARLKIRIGSKLQAVIDRCRDDVVSPFLVHRLPERARPRELRAEHRVHHTQVLPEQLSRGFADARDATDLFKAEANPPTFHEIRSLGGKLYQDAGWSIEQVQALMAHASSEMTAGYLAGHENQWVDVAAGD